MKSSKRIDGKPYTIQATTKYLKMDQTSITVKIHICVDPSFLN
jgi:hypothetical protein